jgi:hypothetical protein
MQHDKVRAQPLLGCGTCWQPAGICAAPARHVCVFLSKLTSACRRPALAACRTMCCPGETRVFFLSKLTSAWCRPALEVCSGVARHLLAACRNMRCPGETRVFFLSKLTSAWCRPALAGSTREHLSTEENISCVLVYTEKFEMAPSSCRQHELLCTQAQAYALGLMTSSMFRQPADRLSLVVRLPTCHTLAHLHRLPDRIRTTIALFV